MLDPSRVITIIKSLADFALGGIDSIKHVSGTDADTFVFNSSEDTPKIELEVGRLAKEFGLKTSLTSGQLPGDTVYWYQVSFVKNT